MGSKSSKIKNKNQLNNKTNTTQSIQSIPQKKKPIKKDISWNIPNPIFKYNKKFKFHSDDENIFQSILEIYQLKNVNNAIYLASMEEDITIYKYFYESNNIETKATIKIKGIGFLIHTIKYYYSPLDKKEYLFVVQNYNSKNIYLIKNENEFELIYNNIYASDDDDIYGRTSLFVISDIYLFDIIYNKYDQNNYIITVYDYDMSDYIKKPYDKYIHIEILKGNDVKNIINFCYKNTDLEIKNIIYEDKNLKKYYIIELEKTDIVKIEIESKNEEDNKYLYSLNLVTSENDCKQLDIFFKNIMEINEKSYKDYNIPSCYMCIVNGLDNNNYLYLISEEKNNNLIIIDLCKRNIVKNIYLNINKQIFGITNWNNDNIILIFDNHFCIYNINTCQIISQYFIDSLHSVKQIYSKDKNLYGIYAYPNVFFFNIKNKNSLK